MPRKDPRLTDVAESINERIQDRTIRHMLYLEGLKTREVRQVLETLDNQILPELLSNIEKRLQKIEKFGFDKGPATTKRLKILANYITKLVSKGNKILHKQVSKMLPELTHDEIMWQVGMIKEELDVDIDFDIPPIEKVVIAIKTKPFDGFVLQQWFENLATTTQNRLIRVIQQGVIEGQTTQQIIKQLVGTKTLKYTDGVLNTTRKQTEAVVRSAIAHISNQARSELFKKNADIVSLVQWNSTLDSRTCVQCMGLDQKTFKIGKGPRPPVHISCRCAVTAIVKGTTIAKYKNLPKASHKTQIPKTLSYGEWLKKQDFATQKQALGTKKAKLFKDGKLKIEQFSHKDGSEVTLEELRKTEKNAFKLAGISV